jgi:hypothetical protein
MRKTFAYIWAGIALVAAAASCQREAETAGPVVKDGKMYVKAEIIAAQGDEGETKTVLSGNGLTAVNWMPGDRISVFSAGEHVRFDSNLQAQAASATFSGTIPVSMGLEEDDDAIWALYPYDADAVYADGCVTTTLPAVQEGKANSFDNNLMLMLGKAANPLSAGGTPSSSYSLNVDFYHICSGIRFQVNRDDIRSVTLTSNGGEALAGTVRVGLDTNGKPEVREVIEASSQVTLMAPSGGFQPGEWYYIVTLPGQLSSGLMLSIATADQEGSRKIRTAFNLARKQFLSDAALDEGIILTDLPGNHAVEVAGPDTWVAVDELGRSMPDRAEAGGTKENRHVVLFYWSWHSDIQTGYDKIFNISYYKRDYPAFTDNSLWGMGSNQFPAVWGYGFNQICFWGQPLFGYYKTTDPWVLRKHAEMLADAGVDAVMFDCTNGHFLWLESLNNLIITWTQAKQDGVKAPKIGFVLNLIADANAAYSLRYLYANYYTNSAFDDMWFKVDGKPLVMAFPESLNASNELGTQNDAAIRDFFTFRPGQGDYVNGDVFGNQWGWMQTFPNMNTFSGGEQITVSVAQNASDASEGHAFAFNSPGTYGRSYTYNSHTYENGRTQYKNTQTDGTSFIYGNNFQEQWDYALEVHPPYIFVTGWNEWIAGMQYQWPRPQDNYRYGVYGPPSFADQYDWEHSRDTEPTADWGDWGDDYYNQLAQNIRRYKGVGNYPYVSRPVTMDIDGDFEGWNEVSPDFRHYPGNVFHRNHDGHSANLTYTNSTGRNDIVDARVTRDAYYVYFYVETASSMTAWNSGSWMRLLINKDCDWTTGWKGYDYCLNLETPASATQGYVSQCTGTEWNWTRQGTFDYRVNGNKMELRIPRSLFGNGKLNFAFKWCDNNLDTNQLSYAGHGGTRILNLYTDGDAAPGGRFNFHYKER